MSGPGVGPAGTRDFNGGEIDWFDGVILGR